MWTKINATISHNKYKDFCWVKNVWGIPWVECKVKLIEQIIWNNKILLSCFDDEIHILNNGYDGLALGY